MSLPSVWLIGERSEPALDDAISWLTSNADCTCFESSTAASKCGRYLSNSAIPQAIVLLQSHPGQYSIDEVEKLHAREPLARLIALTGPWCEGEQRSGRPIPGMLRVPWRSWRERLPLELAINRNAMSRPRTITETELLETVIKSARETTPRCHHVLICAAKSTDCNYLSDALQRLGASATRFGATNASVTSPELVIFDGWEQASLYAKHVSSKNGQPRSRRLLLLHFPRPEDHDSAIAAGIDAVLPHPISIADLNTALSQT